MVFLPDPSDPFYHLMKPPGNETRAQRVSRLKREDEAQRINDAIDEQISVDRDLWLGQERKATRVMIVGQSGSGKSTLLKFESLFELWEWERERNGWRLVIHLNVIHIIQTIIRLVKAEMEYHLNPETEYIVLDESIKFTAQHRMLLLKLAALTEVEAEVKRRLAPFFTTGLQISIPELAIPEADKLLPSSNQFCVRSWRDLSAKAVLDTADWLASAIADHQEHMKALWHDPIVSKVLTRRSLHICDSISHFMNDLARIAGRDYFATEGDIIRAPLRTVGIHEYRLFVHQGNLSSAERCMGWEWRVFDVDFCRTMRRAWIPFFDNMDVMIFLSPLSVFDQWSEEQPKVNCLEDSILLWGSICSSSLLRNIQLILLLNKCDLLQKKLKQGTRVTHYIPSYGARPNKPQNVISYFRDLHKGILRRHSPTRRPAYIYATNTIDASVVAVTRNCIEDCILRQHLTVANLI